MTKGQRPSGLFSRLLYDETVRKRARLLMAQFHAEGKALKMPVRREAVPLYDRLNEIEVLLRREAWPTQADIDTRPGSESEDAQLEKLFQRATPQQRESWRLVLMVTTLRDMLEAASPYANATATLAIEIGMGLMAVATESPNSEFHALVKSIFLNTTPSEQVKNAKHAIRLDRKERNPGQKKPGGVEKGTERRLKEAMKKIKAKRDAYIRKKKRPPGVLALATEVKDENNYPWESTYLRNRYTKWDSVNNVFRDRPAK